MYEEELLRQKPAIASREDIERQEKAGEYYVLKMQDPERNPPKDGPMRWRFVTRQHFARADGPSYCGTWDDVSTGIATHEGVLAECVHKNEWSRTIEVLCDKISHLPMFLERTKINGESYTAPIRMDVKAIEAATGKPVVKYGAGVIIGGQWILQHQDLEYNPVRAAELIAAMEAQKKVNWASKGPIGPLQSRMPVWAGLAKLFMAIKEALQEIRLFQGRFKHMRGYDSSVICFRYPCHREDHTIAIPILRNLYREMTGTTKYRSTLWKEKIWILRAHYMKDPLMRGDFRKMVLEEAEEIHAHNERERFNHHCINHRPCYKLWKKVESGDGEAVKKLCPRGRRLYDRAEKARKDAEGAAAKKKAANKS